MKRLTAALIILIAAAAFAHAETEITIDAPCLTLADMVPGSETGINLTCGFFMGDEKRFPESRVTNVLAHYGVEHTGGDLVVRRIGQQLTEDDVRARIESMLAERHPGLRFELEKVSLPKRTFVKGLDSYDIELPEHQFGSVHGRINNGETTEPVYIYVKAFAEGHVTTHTIRSGEPLAGVTEEREVEVTNIRGALVSNPAGFVAGRTIPKGRAVISPDVEDRPDRFEGETVKLVYSTDVMRIEARGKLLEDAYTGKIVRVENVMTGKIVSAEYAGDSTAVASF